MVVFGEDTGVMIPCVWELEGFCQAGHVDQEHESVRPQAVARSKREARAEIRERSMPHSEKEC